jgi:excisionase family DNA binding protein
LKSVKNGPMFADVPRAFGGVGTLPNAPHKQQESILNIYQRKLEAVGLSIIDAARTAGVGRSSIYEALSSGKLNAKKLGRRTVIMDTDLRDWLASLPAMRPGQAAAKTPRKAAA